jgi:signal transduction histidine kinase/PAS domain-containing protein
MKGNQKRKIEAMAKSLGFGFYHVSEEGYFLNCDSKIREIFALPEDRSDLSMHSIKKFYVTQEEREERINKLIAEECGPLSGTLSVRINGKNKLLFDICWCADPDKEEQGYLGLISEIEDSTIFPGMFDNFPMGLFEINNDGTVVRVNKQLLKMLKHNYEKEILGHRYRDFCEDQDVLDEFVSKIDREGSAHGILRIRDAYKKIIEAECFAQNINEFGRARWGMMNDVTERVSYTRAVEKMPTGFFRIEHPANDKTHKRERITLCNKRFANILGYEEKGDAIGINPVKSIHPDKETGDKFFRDLHDADSRNKPLLNYAFKAKRVGNGGLIDVSLDVHLLKDSGGNIIGREGTVRDLTDEMELRNQVKEAEKRMKKTTDDIDSFVHTFLHPVVQFAGDSDLLHQVGDALYQSVKLGMSHSPADENEDVKGLGKKLLNKLIDIRDIIPDSSEIISYIPSTGKLPTDEKRVYITMGELRENLTTIINTFDYSLQEEESIILLEGDVRITALLVLEELNKLGGAGNDKLKPFIKRDFIEFLQNILFRYLTQSASALKSETESMKKGVETLRDHIVLKEKKKEKDYNFQTHDIRDILEKAVKQFKPSFLEKHITIESNLGTGDLNAKISQIEFERVISNLLLNARKYTIPGKGRFVKIYARELGPIKMVEFSITNFGIPVKKEEIESKAIWEFGYRSELAYGHDRDGRGIGLADAKEVIDAHGGDIELTSRSTKLRPDGPPPRYKVPYITTVTIRIPKNGKQNGENNG